MSYVYRDIEYERAMKAMKDAGQKPARACRCAEFGPKPFYFWDEPLGELRCSKCHRPPP